MRSLLGGLLNRAPVPYTGRQTQLSLPFTSRTNAEQQMAAMGAVGTLFAIVTALANTTSRVDWHLWRKAASGKDEDRVEVTAHPALDVWDRPNPFMPRQEFTEAVQQHLDLTGEGWWIIARNPASPLPLELWPVRPDRMTPVPDPVAFISGYLYTTPDGTQIPLQTSDVIQLRMPNPLDPYRGMGPVQSILVDLDATRYTSEWNRNFFLNSSEPGGIIQVDKRLSDPEFTELRDRWAEQHRGVAAAHRVALIEAGMTWVDRSFSQRDMQFAELRSVSRDVIREAYGIPAFAVGEVADVNRATAEASRAWFAENMLVPRLERIKGALNFEFLPLYGATDLEFDYEDPVPANREADNAELTARANAAKALVDAGYDPVEVLEAVGLPEMTFSGPPAAVTTGAPGQPALPPGALPAPGVVPSRRGAPSPPAARVHVHGSWSHEDEARMAAIIVRELRGSATTEAEAPATREDWETRLDDLVAQWQKEVTPAQIDALVSQIENVVDAGQPSGLSELTIPYDQGAALLADAMVAQARDGAHRMAEVAAGQGVTIHAAVPEESAPANAKKPRPVKTAVGLLQDLTAAATLAAKNLAGAFTSSAATEAMRSWSPSSTGREVAKSVRSHLESLTTSTLAMALGAAIWAAENEGRMATLEQAEADGKGADRYVADEVRDRNTCGPCEEIDGQEFNSLAEVQDAYPFGGYRECDGGTRCRGTFVPVWE